MKINLNVESGLDKSNAYSLVRYCVFALVITFPLLFSSCAMLFNEKSQCIKIYTDSTLKLTKIDSTKLLYHEAGDAEYYVRRGSKPLKLEFTTSDNRTLNYYLIKRISPAYFLANAATPLGLGYVLDLFHKKRFMYAPNNYFNYDSVKHKIQYDLVKPSPPDAIRLGIGWDFVNVYHPALFKQGQEALSVTGLHVSGEYLYERNRWLQAELGYAFAIGPELSKRYSIKPPFDSVAKYRMTNLWLTATYKLQYERWVAGAGLSFAGLKHYEKKDYFLTYDSIRRVPLDTILVTRYSYSSSSMTPLIKAGLNLKAECRINHFITLGGNWQMFFLDLNRPRVYASHFFNFYVMLNVYNTKLKRKKSNDAVNRLKE